MKYVIMCGGTYTAWDTPRQLLQIRGEPIVARTIRLLQDAGVQDISICTHDERFDGFGVPVIWHRSDAVIKDDDNHKGCWCSGFPPIMEPACYIFGDVVFSPTAIRTIVETPANGIRFFTSVPPFSPLFIKMWAEPFAFKVEDWRRFRAAIEFVKASVDSGIYRRWPVSWELWQVIQGKDVRVIDYKSLTPINDYTCDVDHPEDIAAIEAMICRS